MAIVVSALAERDIIGVLRYTEERWGADQALVYAKLLRRALGTLARDPRRGRVRDDVVPGLRAYSVARPRHRARHVIWYRVGRGERVEVVRLLHGAMEPRRHLR